MKGLALKITNPQGTPVDVLVPSGIPTGGLEAGGAGQKLIQLGLSVLFIAGVLLALAFILYAGILWVTSEGDKTKLQAARDTLTYAIIGIVVILVSFVIVQIIITLMGGDPKFFLNIP